MKKILLPLILVLTLGLKTSHAAEGSFGQGTDLFNVGAGARALSMGSAFTAIANDASAPYYNPAGLATMDEHQLMGMYAPVFLDTNFNYLSSAHPFGDKWGAVAISDALLMSDGFEQRNNQNAVVDSDAVVRNNSIFLSYAHRLFWNLSGGVNAKLIDQKVAGFSDSTMGLDVGFLYDPTKLFRVGLMFANLNNPDLTLQSESDEYRSLTRLGLASTVFQDRLTLAFDVTKTRQQDTLYAAGAEYAAHKFFDLRAGFDANRSYTFGIGINLKPFRIDYAFSDSDIGALNKFSFTWAWHNIYKTELDPPLTSGRAVYPLAGFENRIAFLANVPNHTVARWSLDIRNTEGQMVRSLDGDLRPPEEIVWDARNEVGEPVVEGTYNYNFEVKYKNGKSWTVNGDLELALPDHEINEVIDMNLQLNGETSSED